MLLHARTRFTARTASIASPALLVRFSPRTFPFGACSSYVRWYDSDDAAPPESDAHEVEERHVETVRRLLDFGQHFRIVLGDEVGNLLLDFSLPALFVYDFGKIWILEDR